MRVLAVACVALAGCALEVTTAETSPADMADVYGESLGYNDTPQQDPCNGSQHYVLGGYVVELPLHCSEYRGERGDPDLDMGPGSTFENVADRGWGDSEFSR